MALPGFITVLVVLGYLGALGLGPVLVPAGVSGRWGLGLMLAAMAAGAAVWPATLAMPQAETSNGPIGFTCPDQSSTAGRLAAALWFTAVALGGGTLAAASSVGFRTGRPARAFALVVGAAAGIVFGLVGLALPAFCDPT